MTGCARASLHSALGNLVHCSCSLATHFPATASVKDGGNEWPVLINR